MLIHVFLLIPVIGLAALSLLTWRRVPVLVPWRATVLAGEYGHVLTMVTVVWGVVLGLIGGEFAMVGWGLCGFAVIGFMRPTFCAWKIGRGFPEWFADFEGKEMKDTWSGFCWWRLLKGRPPRVESETHEYAPGLKLNFRRAVNREGLAPCVVVIHGGGWDQGDRTELAFFNDWLAREGYAVAAVDYRLAPRHVWPAQREDVLAALNWIKRRALELGVDARRLVLFGRSAGGQIASAVGYSAGDPAIRGVISLYAPYDMRFVWSIARSDDALNSKKLMQQYLGGPPDTPEREERYDSASAQCHVRKGATPPTPLMHGRLDTLVWCRHSERLSARLREEGCRHVFVELPWAAHAFEYNLSGPGGQLTTAAVRRFLQSVTSDNQWAKR